MSMDDSLSLLIRAKLNIDESVQEINSKQIAVLQAKLEKLKLKIEIDDKILNTLTDFSKSIEKMNLVFEKQNETVRKFTTITKELDGTIKTVEQDWKANGTMIEHTTEKIDKQTQAYKTQKQAITELLKASKDHASHTDRYVGGNPTGVTDVYKQGYTTTTINQSGNAESRVTIKQNFETEMKDIEKIKQAELDYWSQRRKEAVAALTQENTELKKMAEYYKQVEKEASDLALYQQKMLGSSGFKGELDIFATKQKGKFDTDSLEKIKKDIKELTIDTPELSKKIKQTGIEFSSLKQQASESGNVMARAIENAGKFLRFYLVGGLLVGGVNFLKSSINVIKDLDSAITNLKKVSTEIGTEIGVKEFLQDVNSLAIEVGHSTKAALDSITSFKKLGYSLRESQELSRTALIYSNVGDLPIEEATQSLISTMKAFNIEAKDSITIIDKLNAVGNNYAISSAGVGQALQRSASSLRVAGNDINESIALITSANAIVQNPEKVGNGLKTVALRLQGISEESGEAIPKLDKLIKQITGVDIMKDKNTFKSTYEILLSISKVWNQVSNIDQATLLDKMFGKQQANVGASILSNTKDLINALETARNSSGSAMAEQAKYMESIQAKINTFNETIVKLWSNTINSDIVKWFVDLGTATITLVDKIGLLPVAIGATVVGFQLLNQTAFAGFMINAAEATATLAVKLGMTATAATTLGTAMATIAPLAIVAGIYGLVKAYEALNVSMTEYASQVNESYNKTQNNIDKIKTLSSEYENLAKKTLLTRDEKAKLAEIEHELNNKFSATTEAIDLQNGALDTNLQKIDSLTKKEAERFQLLNQKAYEKAKRTLNSTYSMGYGIEYKDINEAIKDQEQTVRDAAKNNEWAYNVQKKVLENLYKEYDSASDIVSKYEGYQSLLSNTIENKTNSSINDNINLLQQSVRSAEEYNKALEEQNKQIDDFQSNAKNLASIYDTINEGEKISADTLIDLIQRYPTLTSQIIAANSSKEAGIKLTEALWKIEKERTIQKLEDNKKILESEISILEATAANMAANTGWLGSLSKDAQLSLFGGGDYTKKQAEIDEITKSIDYLKKLSIKDFSSTKTKQSPSPIPYEDMSKELIKSYNAQAELDKIQSKSLEKQIRMAEEQRDYNKQIELTNKLISNQKKTVEDLYKANDKIHSEANTVRTDAKKRGLNYNTESWFDVNGEQSLEYKKLLNSFYNKTDEGSKRAKKAIEDLFNSLYVLKQAYKENKQEVDDLNESNSSLFSTNIENRFKAFDASMSPLTNKIADLHYQFEQLGDGDYSGKINNLTEEMKTQRKIASDYQIEIENLKASYKNGEMSSAQYEARLSDLTNSFHTADLAANTLGKSIKNIEVDRVNESIEKSNSVLEPYSNALEDLSNKLNLLDEVDLSGRISTINSQVVANQNLLQQLRQQYADYTIQLANSEGESAKAIKSHLDSINDQIRQAMVNTREYQRALEELRLQSISKPYDDTNKSIDRSISGVTHNRSMLEDGVLSGTANDAINDLAVSLRAFVKVSQDVSNQLIKYRSDRQINNSDIRSKQQLIIQGGLSPTQQKALTQQILEEIDIQIAKDMKMQSIVEQDLLRQQISNAQSYRNSLQSEYNYSGGSTDYLNELSEKIKEVQDMELSLQEKLKEAIGKAYEYEFTLMDKKLDKGKKNQDILQKDLSLAELQEPKNYDKILLIDKSILEVENNQKKLISDSISELVKQQSALEVGSFEWNLINQKIEDYNTQLQDSNLSIEQMAQKLLQIKFDQYDNSLTSNKNRQNTYEKDLSLTELEDPKNYEKIYSINKSILDLENQHQQKLKDAITELTNQQKTLEVGSGQWNLINDKLQDYKNQLQESNLSIEQMSQKLLQIDFDRLNAGIEEFQKKQENLDYELKLRQLLNPDDLAGFSDIYDRMTQNSQLEVENLQKVLEALREKQSLLQANSTEWDIINNQIDTTIQKIREANLALAQQAQNAFSSYSKSIRSRYSNQVSSGSSGDSPTNDESDYIDGLEKELEIKKLVQYVNENNLKLSEKQLALINQQGKIRQSDLDMLQRELELQQLQIKLENLKQQKTIQTLKQQDDGSWQYEYTTDLDAINKTQDEILDKQLEIEKAKKELEKKQQSNNSSGGGSNDTNPYDQELQRLDDMLTKAEKRVYKSAEEYKKALQSLKLDDLPIDEMVDEYWKYFLETAQIYINQALEITKLRLKEDIKNFKEIGNVSGENYAKGIADAIDSIMSGSGDIVSKQKAIIDMLASKYTDFLLVGNNAGASYVKGMIDSMATPDYSLDFNNIASEIAAKLNANIQQYQQSGQLAASSLLQGLLAGIDAIINNPDITNKTQAILDLFNKVNEYGTLGKALGEEFLNGLISTFTSMSKEVTGEGTSALAAAINEITKQLDSKIVEFAEKGDLQGVAYAEALKNKLAEAMKNANVTVDDIVKILSEFKNFDLAGLLSGEAYQDSITIGFEGASDAAKDSNSAIVKGLEDDIKKFGDAGTKQGDAYKNAITSAFETAIRNAKNFIDNLTDYINGQKYSINLSVNGENTSPQNIASAASGGMTPSWGSDGKLMMLHENELILNKVQTRDFTEILKSLKNFNILSILAGKINIPNFSNINTNRTNQQIFNIDKLELPNVTNTSGIKHLTEGLRNATTQYAYGKG